MGFKYQLCLQLCLQLLNFGQCTNLSFLICKMKATKVPHSKGCYKDYVGTCQAKHLAGKQRIAQGRPIPLSGAVHMLELSSASELSDCQSEKGDTVNSTFLEEEML